MLHLFFNPFLNINIYACFSCTAGYKTAVLPTTQDQHRTYSRTRKVRKLKNKRHLVLHLAFLSLTWILLTLTLHALISKHTQTCTNPSQDTSTSQTSFDTFHALSALRKSTPHHNTHNYTHSRRTILLLLLLCGDTGAIVNPGPYCPKYPCVVCRKAVKWGQRAIQCDNCCERSEHAGWYHVSCIGSFTQLYAGLVNNNVAWICDGCGLPNFSSSIFTTSPITLTNSFNTLHEHNIDNPPIQHAPLSNPSHPLHTHHSPHTHTSHQHKVIHSTPTSLHTSPPSPSLSTISRCSRPSHDSLTLPRSSHIPTMPFSISSASHSHSSNPLPTLPSFPRPQSPPLLHTPPNLTNSLPLSNPSPTTPTSSHVTSPSPTFSSLPSPTPSSHIPHTPLSPTPLPSLSSSSTTLPNGLTPHNSNSKLRLLNINFRSIKNKLPQFHHILQTYQPDIVIGTETWLTPDVDSTEVFPPPYCMTVIRKDRSTDEGKGGGVFIATKPGLVVQPRPDLDIDCEIVWAQLQLSNCKSLLLAAFYRPPSTNIEYLQTLDTSLSRINADKDIWLSGDFNLPDIDWTALSPHDPPDIDLIDPIIPHTNRRQLHDTFVDTINNYSLAQTVLTPTRTQTKTRPDGAGGPYTISNILDLFLTNNILNITNTQVVPGLSDHDIVLVDADLRPTRHQQRRRPVFLYSRADIDKITQDLTNYSTDFFYTDPYERPFSANWDSLKHAIHTSMENNIPRKTPSNRHSLPWFSRDLRRQHRKKQTLQTCADIQHTRELDCFPNFSENICKKH